MEPILDATGGDPQPFGDLVQAPPVLPPEPATEEPIGHRDMEAGPGEPTGRCDPGIRDRPLDEGVPGSMPGRAVLGPQIPDHLGWEPEPPQVPIRSLLRDGRPHISS